MLKDKTTTSEALSLSKLFNKSSKSSSPIVSEEDLSSQKYNHARAYFKGVQSLPIEQQKEFEGVDEETRDNDFKNKVFTDLYKYDPESSNMIRPEDAALWDNRKNLTRLQRDIAVAKKALTSDIDNISNVKEQPLKFTDLNNPEILAEKSIIKSSNTARDQAMDFLTAKSERYVPVYQEQYKNLSADQKQLMRQNFLNLSKEISPYFENYYGTDKLPMDEIEQDYLISNFESWNAIGGPAFASKKLSTYYQDKVAENQSFLEKTVNTGAKFVDSAAGMILRGVGMLGATVGIGLEEGEGWLENVIDNDLTRYADRIATTNSYNPKEQKRLESIGMSDNPVLNTVEQEQSMITMNTPFEVIGQYGFTAATTLLSFGGAAMVSGSAKVLGATAKAIAGGKALNTTSKGIKIARAISKAKDIGNLLVVGGIAGIEGGMNAASTKKTKLDAFNQDIDSRWDETISNDIYTSVASNPSQTLQVLASQGYQIPSEITTAAAKGQFTSEMANMVADAVKSDPDLYKEYTDKYTSQIEADKQRAETDANKAMYVDFAINSAINGIINATLQKTLNAAPIQKTLNKWGIRKNPLLKEINISNTAGKWSATPIKHTGWKAVKNRLKESTGEAIEEYTQDLSSATAQGYAEDQMKQYIDYKYNNHDVANALEEDTSRSIAAGLESLGESVTSFEAIKAGLYGGLSTFIGGPNVNSRIMSGQGRGEKGRKEGEGAMAYFARRNPIGWRSGITPFFNNSEVKAINEQREKLSSEINNFMSDEKVQDLFFGNAATTTAMAEEQKSVEERDEFEARNQRFMANASQLATLNTLKGTVYHDAVLNSLKERINFDEKNLENPESIESKSVEQFLNTVPNDASQDKVEALTKIKKNSQEMMEQINLFNKEAEKVDKAFGRTISKDAKEAIIIDRLGLEDTQKRIKQLDEELNQVRDKVNLEPNTIDNSSLSKTEKKMYVYGKFENPNNQILSASEIIDLPAIERSVILDPRFANRYSPEQLVEIEKVRVLGLQITPEFNTKIDDRAELEFQRSNTLRQQAAIIEDPQKLEAYITVRKIQKSISLVKKKYDYLNQYTPEEYAEFSDQLSNIEATETSERMMTIREFLKDNPLYTKYIGKQKEENDFYQTLSKNDNYTSMDLKKRDSFGAAYKYLSSKDVDMNDPDAVTLALSEQTQDGKLVFEDYIQSFNKTRPDDAKVIITDITEVIQSFNTINKINSDIKAQQAINKKVVPVTKTTVNQDDPPIFDLASDDLSQETGIINNDEKVIDEDNKPIEVNPMVQKFSTNSSSEVGEIVSFLINDIKTIDENKVSPEIKSKVLNIIDEFSTNSFDTPSELADAMILRAAKIQSESEDNSNLSLIRALNIFAARINLINERKKSNPAQTTKTTIPATNDAGTHSLNARMESLSLNQISNKVNSPAHKFAVKHKIKEFLTKTILPYKTTKVMFMIDPELDAESKASMESAGYMYKPDDNSSIIAVVESSEGQIIINDSQGVKKTYQPIAIMPASGNQTYSGAARMRAIRTHASNQQKGQLIRDEKGNIITTTLHGPIRIVSPKKIRSSSVGKTVIDVLINEASANEKLLIANAAKADRKYNSIYQKLKKTFLDKFEVVKFQKTGPDGKVEERKAFIFDPNGANIEIRRRSIENTTARNSNKSILDLFRTKSEIEVSNRIFNPDMAPDGYSKIMTLNGEPIGEFALLDIGNEVHLSGSLGARTEIDTKYRGKGYGYQAYVELAKQAKSEGKVLVSDTNMTEDAIRVWEKLVKEGYANKVKRLVEGFDNFEEEVYIIDNSKLSISDITPEQKHPQYVEALTANSRISGYQRVLSNTLKGLSKFVPEFVMVDGGLAMSKNSEGSKLIAAIEKQLNTKLNDFLYISSKNGLWSYKLTPAITEFEEGKFSPKKLSDGTQAFTLSLVNDTTKNTIELGEVGAETLTDSTKFSILKNLLIDPSTDNLRKLSNKADKNTTESGEVEAENLTDMILWQISNHNIENKDSRHLSDIFDDDILEVRHEGIQPEISVNIQAPFDMDDKFIDRFGEVQSTNPDNASETSINSPSKAGEVITSEGGVVNELLGTKEDPPKRLNKFQKLINRIIGDATYFEKSVDEKYYVNIKTGEKFLRVTSVINASDQAMERFDPQSPYAAVSSNIGTGIDTFVRDFFDGKINPETNLQEKYPNANDTDLKAFYQQLLELKNKLAFEGKTVVTTPLGVGSSKNTKIIVTGKIKALDSKGNTYEIPVAGTIDLLVHDGRGNFEIIDIKTSRQPIIGEKLNKYTAQLSMYSKFLEDTYGIKVKSISILPVTVKYNNPTSRSPYTVKENSNQVMVKNNELRTAQPVLKPAIKLTPSKTNIVFDKLTAEEQQIVKESIPVSAEETAPSITENTKIDSVEPVESNNVVIDPILGLPIEDFNPWGDIVEPEIDSSNTHEYIPSNLKWGVWDGFVVSTGEQINAAETQKILLKMGINEESWNNLNEDLKRKLLECNGV